MRLFAVLSAIFLSVVCVPGIAGALIINFDDVTAPISFVGATPLSNEYASLGVHFSGPNQTGGGAILQLTTPQFSVGACSPLSNCSGLNALAFNKNLTWTTGGTAGGPETITFDDLWKTVSIWVSQQDPPATATGVFSLLAYDAQGNLADTETSTFANWSLLSVSSERGIKSVELSRSDGLTFAADDLQLTGQLPVPEPYTMLLLGLGLICLGILRRRI